MSHTSSLGGFTFAFLGEVPYLCFLEMFEYFEFLLFRKTCMCASRKYLHPYLSWEFFLRYFFSSAPSLHSSAHTPLCVVVESSKVLTTSALSFACFVTGGVLVAVLTAGVKESLVLCLLAMKQRQ